MSFSFSIGDSSQPIWFDDTSCLISSFSCLGSCATCPSSQYHNCYHSEDVTIECSKLDTASVHA